MNCLHSLQSHPSFFQYLILFLNCCTDTPHQNFLFNIYDIEGAKILTKLQFSALNEPRFRHGLNATSPICISVTVNEFNKHFLMHCPLYTEISEFLDLDVLNLADDSFCSLLLYVNDDIPFLSNKIIPEATINYIKSSKKFKSVNDESYFSPGMPIVCLNYV